MTDQEMTQYCEEHKDNCIVLLKTPRAGDEVDNGMGVEFELTPYALICHDRDKIKLKFDGKNDIESMMRTSDIVNRFEIDNCKSLQAMIDNLKETDGYDVIWRNADYKEPHDLKSELQIGGGSIDCKIVIHGSLKVFYSDLATYFKERVNTSNYDSDIFRKAMEAHNDKTDIIGCRFIGDSAHITDTLYFEDHVVLMFDMTSSSRFDFDGETSKKFLPVNDTIDKRSMLSNLVKALELKVKELTCQKSEQ
jgi:hypothetical protein